MTYVYSLKDITRKATLIKDKLRTDGFYDDTILCRVKTTSGASGIFNRGAKITYTDVIVSGIIEVNPIVMQDKNVVETSDGEARFTCKESYASSVIKADEIWYGYTLTSGKITLGTQYKVKSNRKDLFDIDRIFMLKQFGEY